MERNISFEILEPHLFNLRFCGFYQIDTKSKKIFRIFHEIYMRIVLFLVLMYTVQQIIKVYEVRNNADKVMDTLFLLLTNSDSIYKQVVLWLKADQVETLLEITRGSIFNQGKPHDQELLSRTAKRARLLLRAFNNVALSTCFIWVLYPVILYLQCKSVEFAIWLPFDPNMSPQFYFVAVYVWIQTSWLAFSNTTMDVFISFFLVQCKAQLSILRLDLENIVQTSKIEAVNSTSNFAIIYHERFKKILLHYNEIIRFSNIIQNIFGGAVLYQFLISAWILCTTAYRTINMNPMSMEFWSMLMYMRCILTEVFLYCFFGNEVTHESERLMESAYALEWPEIPLEYRRVLIIFMERIKRPIEPMAGVIIPLSNSTFVSIVRSSYTFYAFLKNTD